MRRLAALATAMALLCPVMAFAKPSIEENRIRDSLIEYDLRFPAADTDETNAFAVRGMCAVTFVRGGSDEVSLYSVPTMGTATSGGTLIAAFAATTTAATVFQPGTAWVRAVATVATTGGSTMRISCSAGQTASTGAGCTTAGLAPYVGTGGRYACEADYAYTEATNTLQVGVLEVASSPNENGIKFEGNSAYGGDAPTGAEIVLHGLTTGELHAINPTSSTTDGDRVVTARPDYFDQVFLRGVRYLDLSNEYGGTAGGGFVEARTCFRVNQYAEVTMTDVPGGDDSVFEVVDNCASNASLLRGQSVSTLPGDPFVKSVWCTANTTAIADWDTDVVDLRDAVPTHRWIDSVTTPGEYYVELNAGGDPTLTRPLNVVEDPDGVDNTMTYGTLGSLAAGEWGYGDQDAAIAFDTIYVNLTAGGDPDSQANGWVDAHYTDAVEVVFEMSNGPTANEYAQEIATLRYGYDELLAEHGSVARNSPLRVDVNAYASSFLSGGLSPGDIEWSHFSFGIHRIWREEATFDALDMECGLGLEFRR